LLILRWWQENGQLKLNVGVYSVKLYNPEIRNKDLISCAFKMPISVGT
jgi:hypothetical protein